MLHDVELREFKGVHTVSPSFYYRSNLSESDRQTIISGPFTTCRGGDSLNLEVCVDNSRWCPTVLERLYPTALLLEPFYKFTDISTMQQWLEERYKEYLLLDLEKSELTRELQTEAHCNGGAVYFSMFLTATLTFAWLLHFYVGHVTLYKPPAETFAPTKGIAQNVTFLFPCYGNLPNLIPKFHFLSSSTWQCSFFRN